MNKPIIRDVKAFINQLHKITGWTNPECKSKIDQWIKEDRSLEGMVNLIALIAPKEKLTKLGKLYLYASKRITIEDLAAYLLNQGTNQYIRKKERCHPRHEHNHRHHKTRQFATA